jgi:hypothetical protein
MVVELVPNIEAIMLRMILKSNAHQKPSTTKPGTILPINRIIRALITSRKNPRVMIVKGIVRNIRMGLIKVLMMARAIAIIRAVTKFST